jgi:hypothetical protein
MVTVKRCAICALLFAALIVLFTVLVGATAMSFKVRAGEVQTRTVDLAVEDRVTIKFTVTEQTAGGLDSHIADPHGNTVKSFGSSGNVNYQFVCSEEGNYTMYFSNTSPTEDKMVTLDYEVQHYIFGIPQMLFMTLIIVGICMAAVTVFVLMGNRH